MKRKLFTLFLFASLLSVNAQDFQWAKRGGSTNALQGSNSYNNILQMVTDEADNIYLLGRVGASNTQVDGHHLKAYNEIGIGAGTDILLTSFSSEGKYRWSKVIGGSTNNGIGLKTINGKVYISGYASANDTAYYDSDTVIVDMGQTYDEKRLFLIQYDTAGALQWLVMPEADSLPQSTWGGYPYWIDVALDGNIYWMCHMEAGSLPNTGQVINNLGIYVLTYDQNGQFLDRTKLDIDLPSGEYLFHGTLNQGNFLYDHTRGRFYIGGLHTGRLPLVIGGDTIKGSMYLAAFDSTGQVIWKKEGGTPPNIGGLSPTNFYDFTLDDSGNIYLTGSSKDGEVLINNILYSSPKIYQGPFIIKLDKNGNTIWTKSSASGAGSPANKVVVFGNTVAISGYCGSLHWQGPNDEDTITHVPNQGYDAFIAIFDKENGNLLQMESAQTNFNGRSYGYALTADSEGSWYMGGNYDQQLYLGPDTLYKIGSQRSFFVTKYACNTPESDFTYGLDTTTYYFNYTGTEADSVIWDFGDGFGPVMGDSVYHTYTSVGSYNVCATAYSYCGDTTFCQLVNITTVGETEHEFLSGNFQLSPNPATDIVRVKYQLPNWKVESDVVLEVRDLRGSRIGSYELNNSNGEANIYTSRWNGGVYIVVLKVDGAVQEYKRLMIER